MDLRKSHALRKRYEIDYIHSCAACVDASNAGDILRAIIDICPG